MWPHQKKLAGQPTAKRAKKNMEAKVYLWRQSKQACRRQCCCCCSSAQSARVTLTSINLKITPLELPVWMQIQRRCIKGVLSSKRRKMTPW